MFFCVIMTLIFNKRRSRETSFFFTLREDVVWLMCIGPVFTLNNEGLYTFE